MAKELTYKFPGFISIEDHASMMFWALLTYGKLNKYVSDNIDDACLYLGALAASDDLGNKQIFCEALKVKGVVEELAMAKRDKDLVEWIDMYGAQNRADVLEIDKVVWELLQRRHHKKVVGWFKALETDDQKHIFSDEHILTTFALFGLYDEVEAIEKSWDAPGGAALDR